MNGYGRRAAPMRIIGAGVLLSSALLLPSCTTDEPVNPADDRAPTSEPVLSQPVDPTQIAPTATEEAIRDGGYALLDRDFNFPGLEGDVYVMVSVADDTTLLATCVGNTTQNTCLRTALFTVPTPLETGLYKVNVTGLERANLSDLRGGETLLKDFEAISRDPSNYLKVGEGIYLEASTLVGLYNSHGKLVTTYGPGAFLPSGDEVAAAPEKAKYFEPLTGYESV